MDRVGVGRISRNRNGVCRRDSIGSIKQSIQELQEGRTRERDDLKLERQTGPALWRPGSWKLDMYLNSS